MAAAPLLAVFLLTTVACRGSSSDPIQPIRRAESSVPSVEQSSAPKPVETNETGPPVRRDGTIMADAEMMGTRFSINLWLDAAKTPQQAAKAIEMAFMTMQRIEDIASEWRPQSDLSRLNRHAGQREIEIPEDLFEILARSKTISAATEGRFDVTFHAIGQLWSFKPGSLPPSSEAITAALNLVDWRGIELSADGKHARLAQTKMAVGLGAVAKGFAVDAGSQVLRDHGFTHHIVEGGGDTFISGTKGGQPWRVGIQNPRRREEKSTADAHERATTSIGWISVSNQAVVTSGNYERYFEYEGRYFTHILDPSTGWPLARDKSPRSVTLVADNATDADAYCTAVTVMGSAAGMAFVEARNDLETVIVDASGQILLSSGLAKLFVRNPNAHIETTRPIH